MKVDPALLRQRLRHIRNELGVLGLRRSNIVAAGNAVKPSALRKVMRRIAVLHAEEVAIRQSLGDLQPGVTLVQSTRRSTNATRSWRKGFSYGNQGRTAGPADHREG